jgi:hypothetical protein
VADSPIELLHSPGFLAAFAAIRDAEPLTWTQAFRAAANNYHRLDHSMSTVPSIPDPPWLHRRSSQLPPNGSGLVGTVTSAEEISNRAATVAQKGST